MQPVYKDPEDTIRQWNIPKSQSCPNLFMDENDEEEAQIIPNIKFRERAFSESIKLRQKKLRSISSMTLNRVQSDSDLSHIDKEKTFAADTRGRSKNVMPGDLLAKLVVALGGYRIGDEQEVKQASIHSSVMGVQGFSDSQILATEQNYGSDWTIGSEKSYVTPPFRPKRANSEIRIPIEESVKVSDLLQQLKRRRMTFMFFHSLFDLPLSSSDQRIRANWNINLKFIFHRIRFHFFVPFVLVVIDLILRNFELRESRLKLSN